MTELFWFLERTADNRLYPYNADYEQNETEKADVDSSLCISILTVPGSNLGLVTVHPKTNAEYYQDQITIAC